MSHDDGELITEFGKISKLMPNVLFDFVMGNLTPDRQREFGDILIMLGDLLIKNAKQREESDQPITIEGHGNPTKGLSR